jgi:glycosyltransferase involved in cell wall biosynthesis
MTKTARRFFVVTPVLNGAAYLPAALASIDAQTWRDWTHIVVDAGSTDGTPEIVRTSVRSEPRRRLIEGRDRGLYDGVFKGFEAIEAAGAADDDICLWLNADDYLAPWALATMRLAFDMYDADWVTGQPGRWDAEGRLVLIEARSWYPRWFIANGWFNLRCLGAIQQESTFFSLGLLRRLAPSVIETIRGSRLAGDFLLWREFARSCPLHAAPTVIGGFRLHGDNMSIRNEQLYIEEARKYGAFILPVALARCVRFAYRIVAAISAVAKARHPLTDKS